ncbi:hypothetical protein IKO50_01045 [bacterium]|nr:hypothetical protein [bacterium]
MKDDRRLNNKNIPALVNNVPEVKYCLPNKAVDISGQSAISSTEKLIVRIEK